ncbi:MAG TPA: hypothetical protein VI122_00320 [Thermoleophilaceae bacterium]|jgi:hypothetical protein
MSSTSWRPRVTTSFRSFRDGERVVVLGKESFEIKKTGATVPGSEHATVLDIHDGLTPGSS